MTKFEDALWTDLMDTHGDRLAAAQRPEPKHGTVRPLTLTAGALGAAGAATALALTLTATSGAPAYAVTRNFDGTIRVTIRDIAGVSGANAELAKLGVHARALPYSPECTAAVYPATPPGASAPRPGQPPKPVGDRQRAPDEVTIEPRKIPRGDTLVLAANVKNGRVQVLSMLVSDPAPSCLPGSKHPGIGSGVNLSSRSG
jgi:hypothetical protein